MTYRLDYRNGKENRNYFQMFADYGWEYVDHCFGWLYFRKPASETDSVQDSEIFSDGASKVDMLNDVLKTRMLPLLIVFFCCVLPNLFRGFADNNSFANAINVFFVFMTILYLYLLTHCGRKLRKLRERYKNL